MFVIFVESAAIRKMGRSLLLKLLVVVSTAREKLDF